MRQSYRKIQRVQPLLKIRKSKVDQEIAALLSIRAEKQRVVAELRESQKKYMQGVEDLNKIRTSTDRTNLSNLEEALDAVKIRWYNLFRQAQEAENREKEQVNQLMAAERDLKVMENLEGKYTKQLQKDLLKIEQKSLDEHAVRRHTINKV